MVTALPDTGAMMTVGGLNLIHAMKVTKKELTPVSMTMSAANNGKMRILGMIFVEIRTLTTKT